MKIKDLKGLLENEELSQTAAGPELDSEKELDNEATLEKEPEELTPEVDNEDVYSDDEHDQAEEVKEVVVTEEESQVANGPELEKAGELENEATLEKEPEENDLEKDNKDVYCDKCHDQTEEVKEVVVTEEESQVAAGPELEAGKELDNEATLEKEPEELTPEVDNEDVYSDDEHDQAEEVKEVVVTESTESFSDYELMKILKENGYRPTIKNVKVLKEGIESGKFSIIEDELTEPAELAVADKLDDDVAPVGEIAGEVDELLDEPTDAEELEQADGPLTEEESQVANGPELEKAGELENEATLEKEPEELEPEVDNEDVYSDDEHDQAEEVKEVEISEGMSRLFNLIDTLNEELSQTAAGPELDSEKELDNEATLEKEPEEDDLEKDNEDVYSDDEHDQAEEVKEVVVTEEAAPEKLIRKYGVEKTSQEVEGKKGYVGPIILGIFGPVLGGIVWGIIRHEKNEAADSRAYHLRKAVEKDQKCMKIIKEIGKEATGAQDKTKLKELKKELKAAMIDLKVNGKVPLTESIYLVSLFEEDEKTFDVDATLASDAGAEMGTDENEKDIESHEDDHSDVEPKDLIGVSGEDEVTPDDLLKESVKYTSLREACALDEDYFVTDSYTIETADAKQSKLTEQVSLLMAREAMDPMYDELLKTSLYAQRLQESLVGKYRNQAAKKVEVITEQKVKHTLKDGVTERTYDYKDRNVTVTDKRVTDHPNTGKKKVNGKSTPYTDIDDNTREYEYHNNGRVKVTNTTKPVTKDNTGKSGRIYK